MDTKINYEENYSCVLYELTLFHNYKYKDLVRYLNIHLNTTKNSVSSYTFKQYNFNNEINICPKIIKYGCYTYELFILINNNRMYSSNYIFDEDDDDDNSNLKCISSFDEDILKNADNIWIEKIKKIIDFLDNFSDNYIYSPYLDEFISKFEITKKIRLENQINDLCKNTINECIICYNEVNANLTTFCCNKHICRICINKIKEPLKCPNCRKDYF